MSKLSDIEKELIQKMRTAGFGYKAIATRISIPRETVRSYCIRNNLSVETESGVLDHDAKIQCPSDSETFVDNTELENDIQSPANTEIGTSDVCKQCGSHLIQIEGRKKRVFCSDDCRKNWWRSHPEKIHRKAISIFTCFHCGKPFSDYSKTVRKYCSHECYVNGRFGKAVTI